MTNAKPHDPHNAAHAETTCGRCAELEAENDRLRSAAEKARHELTEIRYFENREAHSVLADRIRAAVAALDEALGAP